MATTQRVTVTLPGEILREMDRIEKNRTRFVLDAIRRELERRRRQDLRQSLRNPHLESEQLTEAGFDEWVQSLPEEDAGGLVDLDAGTPVRWVPGRGWEEAGE